MGVSCQRIVHSVNFVQIATPKIDIKRPVGPACLKYLSMKRSVDTIRNMHWILYSVYLIKEGLDEEMDWKMVVRHFSDKPVGLCINYVWN